MPGPYAPREKHVNAQPVRPVQRARVAALVAIACLIAALGAPAGVAAVDPVPHLEFGVGTANPGPLTGTAGGSLNFTFSVAVKDANGQTVTTGDVSATQITLGLAPNTAGAAVSCTGGLTVAAVGGV